MKNLDNTTDSPKISSKKELQQRFEKILERKASKITGIKRVTGKKQTTEAALGIGNFFSTLNTKNKSSARKIKIETERSVFSRESSNLKKRQVFGNKKEKLSKKLLRDFVFSENKLGVNQTKLLSN